MNTAHHNVSSYFFPILRCFIYFLLGFLYCSHGDDCWSSPCEQFYFCLFYAIFCDLMNINLLLTVWNMKKYRCLLLTAWAVRFGYNASFSNTCCFIVWKNGYFTPLNCSPRELHKFISLCYDIDTVKRTDKLLPWHQQHFKAGCIRQRMFIQATTSYGYRLGL